MSIARRIASFLVFFSLQGLQAFSQGERGVLPQFEVVSVKPSDPERSHHIGILIYPGGRFDAENCTLKMLIEIAYDVQAFQVTGGPKWIGTEPYSILALPPASSGSSRISLRPYSKVVTDEQKDMLKSLLQERFSLSIRREVKDGPILVLEQNGKVLGLHEPVDKTEFPWMGGVDGGMVAFPTGIAGQNISMPLLAQRLSRYFVRPVVDQTKLSGSYDFKMRLTDREPDEEITTSIVLALDGLGLRLRKDKGPTEGIVIEDAKRPLAN